MKIEFNEIDHATFCKLVIVNKRNVDDTRLLSRISNINFKFNL